MTEIKFNVLIAEDEENIGNFISTILKTNGYKPIIATTGNQAIQCAESYCPDVILLDLGLPDMDGIDVISEIRKWAVTPIIVISARNRESEKVKALDAGADDYITKPFSAAYLKARIFNLLEQRKKLQVLYCASLLPLATEQQATEQTEKSSLPSLSPNDQKFMDKVMEAIEKHLDNGDLMVEDIASEVNMSRSVFFKKLKTLTGLSPVEFLREIRMKRAAQLIETEEYSMAQIAYMVGLNDSHYFSKCFKQQYGITPTEYKESRKQTSL